MLVLSCPDILSWHRQVKLVFRAGLLADKVWLPGNSANHPARSIRRLGNLVRVPGDEENQPVNPVRLLAKSILQQAGIKSLPGSSNFLPGTAKNHQFTVNFLPWRQIYNSLHLNRFSTVDFPKL